MSVTRRLLMAAAGAGAFTIPPILWTLTAADDGGWTHANAPRAIEYGGIVYFGYVDMASGNIEVRAFDPSTGITGSATVLHAALQVDSHAAPTLWVRPDGRLLVVYSAHDGATMYRRISTNPLPDISSFAAEGSLDASLGGSDYTYPILLEYGADAWLFYRDFQGSNTAVLMYSVSTDDGATWSAQTEVYRSASRSSYWMVDSTGSRIDIAVSDGRNPPDSDPVTISHLYYDGTWRASDGTSLGALPFTPSDLTEVYDAGDGMGWPMDIVSSSEPVFVYAVLNDPASNSWRRAHWTGSAWVNRTIAESNHDIDSGFASSVCLDHTDPDRAYAPVLDGTGSIQMYAYFTANDGVTWTARALTTGSDDNVTPAPVYASSGLVKVVWMTGGPYVSYLMGGFGLAAGR